MADLNSPTHKLETQGLGSRAVQMALVDDDERANRDVIVEYRLAGERTATGLMLHRAAEPGGENFFLALVEPPQAVQSLQINPRDYIFVVDISGSMHGYPLATAKVLLPELIEGLRPSDTFNVMLFAGSNRMLSEESVPATRANIERALKTIDKAGGGGSTEIVPALRRVAALPKPADVSRTVIVITDGYVAVESEVLRLQVFHPGIVMEGGSVEFNGKGTILTTTASLLNKNRNPHLSQYEIEQYLTEYYGIEHILWLDEGIVGDDTDGHIDDITRFVNYDTVVTVIEKNKSDDNYDILKDNLKLLKKMRLADDNSLNIVELPMPHPVIYEDQRLPASYANFYISNEKVIVPTFRDDQNDTQALEILEECFPDRKVIGIDSVDIIWGLGSFHCLSQQEPDV